MYLKQEKAWFGLLLAWGMAFLGGCGSGALPELEENLAAVIREAGPSVVGIVGKNESSGKVKLGSGVILADNYILTIENILGNVDNITVKLQDGSIIPYTFNQILSIPF